ncbi:Rv3235 family protein [Streptomyces sp. Je 1-79]|uniref:Rv3235 family protein n=1 Tax=Streptomyces sp. Je 1-79 TaxID=2943847 RepID=UPI0021A2D377|nr:Rv3235 family protein [Streptomyces sp. Je 1-79]MCT4355973.1 Rv3235 family protein [Streptomyces sp. Je 1-79]
MTTAATSPRTARTAPRGPAGTGPRGRAGKAPGARPGIASRTTATTPRALPPHAFFAERLLAVLTGERPVHWMLGQTVGEAYEQLVQLAPQTPLRIHGARPVLRTCHFHPPRTDAVEVFATVAAGERIRAMAFRLERGADRRWRCAAVELDGLHARATQAPQPRVPAQAAHR